MARITIYDAKIDSLVTEVLGFDQWIDRGYTGREYRANLFERFELIKERASFALWDLAEAANVLDDDTLMDAALAGITAYLEANKEEIQAKINTQATIAAAELLDTDLYWVVDGDKAEAWSTLMAAENEIKRRPDEGLRLFQSPTSPFSKCACCKGGTGAVLCGYCWESCQRDGEGHHTHVRDAAVAAYEALQRGAPLEPLLCPECGAGISDCATNGCGGES